MGFPMKQQAHYRHRFSAQFSLGLILSGLSLAAVAAHAADIIRLDATVVTASGWQEPVERVSSTIHAISAEHIQRSRASSLTELPGEHAVGFFSE
jgi:outer membrane cobalamin receptor